MININISSSNIRQLQRSFARAPKTTATYLEKALKASIFEVEKRAVDRNFRFKTPRAMRTGMLANSFKTGIKFYTGQLKASIGPTVKYAPYVYYGTSRGIRPNRYMDRIAKDSERAVGKHFKDATNRIVDEVAI